MQFSPYKKPFEEEIIEWYGKLKLTSDILEDWGKFQGQWMYLQPIFDSPDIAKQLPLEHKKFKQVDIAWKQMMSTAKSVQNIMIVCKTEGLLEKIKECNKNLDIIQKELSNYLEKKRERFARFYFLSDDELLEILSQTKEPTAVQPHLKKVFENIASIEFDESKKILAMFSGEREKIPFVSVIDPVGKSVEDWMNEVEDSMKESIRYCLLNSIKVYDENKRKMWVLEHPGQCILNGSQIIWTHDVETAFIGKEITTESYFQKLQNQLNDLVDLVRTKLTKQVKFNFFF